MTPQELITGASCIDCMVPPGMGMAVMIALLMDYGGITSTPAELVAAAACFNCIPSGMRQAAMIALLNEINGA